MSDTSTSDFKLAPLPDLSEYDDPVLPICPFNG